MLDIHGQAALVYYGGAFLLHFVVPLLLPVQSVQVGSRRPGQVMQEVVNSLGKHPGFI